MEKNEFIPGANEQQDEVKLWARVGVTIQAPESVYDQLLNEDTAKDVMRSILKGETGRVFLDGETYFPELDSNRKLSEVEFDFYEPSGNIAFLPAKEPLQSFYYTFGTASHFPYHKGWVEVRAENRQEADEMFRQRFPDVTPGVLNCSWVYGQEQFKKTLQSYEGYSDWNICHETISKSPATEKDRYSKEDLLDVLESYARMIRRNKDYPTVLIDDLDKSIQHVLKANGRSVKEPLASKIQDAQNRGNTSKEGKTGPSRDPIR